MSSVRGAVERVCEKKTKWQNSRVKANVRPAAPQLFEKDHLEVIPEQYKEQTSGTWLTQGLIT